MTLTTRLHLLLLAASIACVLPASLKAQEQSKDSITYAIVIKFSSIGTGVPADTPLRNCIKSFKKKNKVNKIAAKHIGPMGKEGEYWLAFSLKELTQKQKAAFKKQVKATTEKMTGRGQATYEENITIVKTELGRANIADVMF
jgi:hypothetical protein